jgi:N-acetylglucosamine kinase-like BadF-type ATPase
MSVARLIGIDGGGTSTVAWLADSEGNILGRGAAGPSNYKAVGGVAAKGALDRAIASAFVDAGLPVRTVEVACLGLAGFDRPEDRELLIGWSAQSGWADRLLTVNDGDLVIAAGTPEGWGIGVIAGTGSIAVGRARDGRSARAGGWGPLIGDEGSGYAVALTALRRVAHRADGREPRPRGADPLTDHLCQALGIDGPARLVSTIYSPDRDRTRIAALAPAVVAAAAEDPEIERSILEPAGRDLAQAVIAVAGALGWPSGPLPLALAGGFLLAASSVSRSLLAHLTSAGYEVAATAVDEPVRGAVLLAKRSLASG